MSKPKKIPAPSKQPAIYDAPDNPEAEPRLGDAYRKAVLPPEVAERISERNKNAD